MGMNIWDAIISGNFKFSIDDYIADMNKVYDDYERIKTQENPAPETASDAIQKAYLLSDMLELFILLYANDSSAQGLLKATCKVLLHIDSFSFKGAYPLSAGMLTFEQRVLTLKDEELTDDQLVPQIVYDILKPNIYCALLLEARGQVNRSGIPKSLHKLRSEEDSYNYKSYDKLPANVSKFFPLLLQELFNVTRDAKNKEYQIATSYPTLFLSILSYSNISPMPPASQDSLAFNSRFYDSCIKAILRNGEWCKASFEDYYIFERLFRLNTKINLAVAEFSARKKKDREPTLSAALLGDFFFSSPLVFFPKFLLPHLFYEYSNNSLAAEDENINLNIDTGANHFLHLLIQLSSLWFPASISVLRYYMQNHNIVSYDDVNRFLFPKSEIFPSLQEKFKPYLPDIDSVTPASSFQTRYSSEWKKFVPRGGYCVEGLTTPTLNNWKNRGHTPQYTAVDGCALFEIKESL